MSHKQFINLNYQSKIGKSNSVTFDLTKISDQCTKRDHSLQQVSQTAFPVHTTVYFRLFSFGLCPVFNDFKFLPDFYCFSNAQEKQN